MHAPCDFRPEVSQNDVVREAAVSQEVGFTKGKSAIHLARVYEERKRNFVGQSFWARGFMVSTVGRNEAAIRDYIRNQEEEDKHLDQLKLWQ
jgi:putative transposase